MNTIIKILPQHEYFGEIGICLTYGICTGIIAMSTVWGHYLFESAMIRVREFIDSIEFVVLRLVLMSAFCTHASTIY